MQFGVYQPKWQANDYYQNNFRLNKGDSVRMRYNVGTATPDTAGSVVVMAAGATSLAASVALGAILLSL